MLDALGLLSRRLQRRVARALVVIVGVAAVVAPGLRLHERVTRWVVDAYTEQYRERLDDLLGALIPSPTGVATK